MVCPGCQASQDVPAADSTHDPPVVACHQCRANLILVAPDAGPVPPQATHNRFARTRSVPIRTANAPRSALVAVGLLCTLSYLGTAILLYGASYGIKQLPPYRVAEAFVTQHPVLTQALGEPIESGWFPTAHVYREGRKARAYVELRVSGPRGSGQVGLSLIGEQQAWRIFDAQYQVGEHDARPLWIQFPGDFALRERLEAIMVDLDEATNARDVDRMMKHIAPDATFRFILEIPPNRQLRTFRNREEFRREVLANILMVKHVSWTRHETEFQLAPDGRTATGKFLWTHKVIAQGKPVTFSVDETITYSVQENEPFITSVDGVQQLAGQVR